MPKTWSGWYLVVLAFLELEPVDVLANILPHKNTMTGEILTQNPQRLFKRHSLLI